MKDGINDWCDKYGGSVENICHFGLKILSSVMEKIGAERKTIRISLIVDHLYAIDSYPIGLGLYLVQQFNLMAA